MGENGVNDLTNDATFVAAKKGTPMKNDTTFIEPPSILDALKRALNFNHEVRNALNGVTEDMLSQSAAAMGRTLGASEAYHALSASVRGLIAMVIANHIVSSLNYSIIDRGSAFVDRCVKEKDYFLRICVRKAMVARCAIERAEYKRPDVTDAQFDDTREVDPKLYTAVYKRLHKVEPPSSLLASLKKPASISVKGPHALPYGTRLYMLDRGIVTAIAELVEPSVVGNKLTHASARVFVLLTGSRWGFLCKTIGELTNAAAGKPVSRTWVYNPNTGARTCDQKEADIVARMHAAGCISDSAPYRADAAKMTHEAFLPIEASLKIIASDLLVKAPECLLPFTKYIDRLEKDIKPCPAKKKTFSEAAKVTVAPVEPFSAADAIKDVDVRIAELEKEIISLKNRKLYFISELRKEVTAKIDSLPQDVRDALLASYSKPPAANLTQPVPVKPSTRRNDGTID